MNDSPAADELDEARQLITTMKDEISKAINILENTDRPHNGGVDRALNILRSLML